MLGVAVARQRSSRRDALAATLYMCPQLSDRGVGTDEHGALALWPRTAGGWAFRTPYGGHRRSLRAVDPAEARGTGWPGGGVGRRRLAGAGRGLPLTIRIDDKRRTALQKLAAQQGQQVSDTVREGIDLVIARGVTCALALRAGELKRPTRRSVR